MPTQIKGLKIISPITTQYENTNSYKARRNCLSLAIGSALLMGTGNTAAQVLELSDLNGSNGFVLHGIDPSDNSGSLVSAAGDINGDGVDDLIIGAFFADPNGERSGESYVVFGTTSPSSSVFELSDLNGSNGFTLNGVSNYDRSGESASTAGDFNGDGVDDLIIGATNAEYNGQSYVVFGNSSTAFGSVLELSALNGNNGFTLNGINLSDNFGDSVSTAGDVNGDGLQDLVIGADFANGNDISSGQTYVVFGNSMTPLPFGAVFELSDLDGSNGFILNGTNSFDRSGSSVSTAGDINGDGLGDIIIGASNADTNGENSGVTYVVFGSTSPFPGMLDLSALNGNNGFTINGIADSDLSGFSVSSAGDINADGLDDLIIGAFLADPNGGASGQSYVIFGNTAPFAAELELSALDSNNGFFINGVEFADASGISVSAAGDINSDGIADLLIGALRADPNDINSGESYVIFGSNSSPSPFGSVFELSTLNGDNGFIMHGINTYDYTGTSVSNAGDFNGDGVDDIIVGASFADPNGDDSGESYVVFGRAQILETRQVPTLRSWALTLLVSLLAVLGWRKLGLNRNLHQSP